MVLTPAEVYLNGAFVALHEAKVSVMDRGFLFGDGAYEVIPAYGGRPLRQAHHLARLGRSLRGIRMEDPLPRARWSEIFSRLLAGAPGRDQAIYLQVTRGAAPVRDHRFGERREPTVFAMARPMRPRDPAVVASGVRAILREDTRWQRCDLKVISLVAAVLLRQEAEDNGAEEAILIRDGLAVEASTSNLFLVEDDVILTPPKDHRLLPGITRDLVLELASGAGLTTRERDIPVETLRNATEVWITSSTREIMPVTRLDGAPVGDGRPGPLWRRLDALYQAYKADMGEADHA